MAFEIKIGNSLFPSSELPQPPQVQVDGTTWGVLAAIAVIFLCIGITIIAFICLKRRKQHAKKIDLHRFAVLIAEVCALDHLSTKLSFF